MAVFIANFVLYLCFNLMSGYVILDSDENEIIWPTEYHFNAEKLDLFTTLKVPFEIWYSDEQNRSRIDYEGGSTKKFYYGDLGVIYTEYPTTDDDLVSGMVCRSRSFDLGQPDFLPEASEFSYAGVTSVLFDKQVQLWTSKVISEQNMIMEEMLYVHKTTKGFDIPVQHIIKMYYLVNGAVTSHSVINYYGFKDSVSEDELTVEADYCSRLAELGDHFRTDIQMLHPDLRGDVDIAFDSYYNHHRRGYQEAERAMRKQIFEKNWRMVRKHNRKNLGFKMALNQFSDKTDEELKYLTGTFVPEHPTTGAQPFPHSLTEIDEIVEDLPENYDLRLEGVVTPVKHQGSCGSCWAFCTTATVEGAIAKINGDRLLDFSEQSLVDCAWTYNNLGCNGGEIDGAYKYLVANGIPTERQYGIYTEHDGYCKLSNMTNVNKIKGFAQVTPRSPSAMKVALYKYGPVAVAIHASSQMQQYSSGIFYDFTCAEATPNHGVTVVGYGNRNGEDYWLVKNSWGESWGEDGYILMSAKDNNCFLLDTAFYPIV